MIDFFGPGAALKVQVPLSGLRSRSMSSEQFEGRHHLVNQTFFLKWAQVSQLSLGHTAMKHYRRCFCKGALHPQGFKQHYIDMAAEEISREDNYEPNPESLEDEEMFDSHPLEIERPFCFIENDDRSENESEDEHWDPKGEETRSLMYLSRSRKTLRRAMSISRSQSILK